MGGQTRFFARFRKLKGHHQRLEREEKEHGAELKEGHKRAKEELCEKLSPIVPEVEAICKDFAKAMGWSYGKRITEYAIEYSIQHGFGISREIVVYLRKDGWGIYSVGKTGGMQWEEPENPPPKPSLPPLTLANGTFNGEVLANALEREYNGITSSGDR